MNPDNHQHHSTSDLSEDTPESSRTKDISTDPRINSSLNLLPRKLIDQRGLAAKLRNINVSSRLNHELTSSHELRHPEPEQRDSYIGSHQATSSRGGCILIEPISPPASPRESRNPVRTIPSNLLKPPAQGHFNSKAARQAEYLDNDNMSEEQRRAKALEEYLREVCAEEGKGGNMNGENIAILKQAAYENWIETIQRLNMKKTHYQDRNVREAIQSPNRTQISGMAGLTLTPNESPELANENESFSRVRPGITDQTNPESPSPPPGVSSACNKSPVQNNTVIKCSPLKRRLEEYRSAPEYIPGKIGRNIYSRASEDRRESHDDDANQSASQRFRYISNDERLKTDANQDNFDNEETLGSQSRRYIMCSDVHLNDTSPSRRTDYANDMYKRQQDQKHLIQQQQQQHLIQQQQQQHPSQQSSHRWLLQDNHKSIDHYKSLSAAFDSSHKSLDQQQISLPSHHDHSSSIEFQTSMDMRRAMEMRSSSRMSPSSYSSVSPDASMDSVIERMTRAAGQGSSLSSSREPGDDLVKFSGDDHLKFSSEKDSAYWERRRKNNEAAKRSRDTRRAKEEQTARRASLLAEENLQLRAQIAILKTETANLQLMLYNRMS